MEDVEPSLFRRVVGRNPTGVCVVSTRLGGLDQAMTVTAFASVSLEPPLVLVCVEVDSRFHDAVLETGVWGVSLLDGTGRPAAEWLANRGRPVHGQLDRLPHTYGPVTGVPLLAAATGTLECRTFAVHPGGDHDILVGEVVGAAAADTNETALVHHRSTYKRLS